MTRFAVVAATIVALVSGIHDDTHAGQQLRGTDSVVVTGVRFENLGDVVNVYYDLVIIRTTARSEALVELIGSLSESAGEKNREKKAVDEILASLGEDGSADKNRSVRAIDTLSTTEFRVTVYLRKESDPAFRYQPRRVSGDIGTGKFAGRNRSITWNFIRELPQGLEGDDFFFEVRAEPFEKTDSSLLWWIGGGAAVVGGSVLTYFLLSSSESETTQRGFPAPPGRPQ